MAMGHVADAYTGRSIDFTPREADDRGRADRPPRTRRVESAPTSPGSRGPSTSEAAAAWCPANEMRRSLFWIIHAAAKFNDSSRRGQIRCPSSSRASA